MRRPKPSHLLRLAGALAFALACSGAFGAWPGFLPNPLSQPAAAPVRLDDLSRSVASGDVVELSLPVMGGPGIATFRDGRVAPVVVPFDDGTLSRRAVDAGVRVSVVPSGGGGSGVSDFLAGNVVPIVLLASLAFGLWRRGIRGAFEYRPARSLSVGFADVAGAEEAKEALSEAVDFVRDPKAYARLGAPAPRGLLLVGAPGGGKTLLASALAKEAGVGMIYVKGGEVSGIVIGAGARRVAAIFREARRRAPCILFVDEFDALAPRRSDHGGAAASEDVKTVSQLLVELQGLEGREGVFVVGATNRPHAIDPAVLRRGRLDAVVEVPPLDEAARRTALAIGLRKVPRDPSVDVAALARSTAGLSGADLAAVCAEASRVATRAAAGLVDADHFAEAIRRVTVGRLRGDLVLSDEDARAVSVHEAGHALAACLVDAADPVVEATVEPRGRTLGYVATLPAIERRLMRRGSFEAGLAVLLAGRAAEAAVFGPDQVTDGAAADLKAAIRLVDDVLSRFGLVGGFDVSVDVVAAEGRPTGDAATAARDAEVARRISAKGEEMVRLMTLHLATLESLADHLVARRTVSGDEVRAFVRQHPSRVAVAAE